MELEYILTENKPTVIHLPTKNSPYFKYFKKKLIAKQPPKKAFILSLDMLFKRFQMNEYSQAYQLLEEKPENAYNNINRLAADFNAKKISVIEFYQQSAAYLNVDLEWKSNAYSNLLKIPQIVNDECISLYLYEYPFQTLIKSNYYNYNLLSDDLEELKKFLS
jgi:hypothetical protein